MPSRERRPMILAIVALCLVAVMMRPAISAVGPLIDRMSADTGIPLALLGALSTIVLITWTVVSPFAHGIGQRLGLGRAILAALGLLAVGLVVRSLPGSSAWLWIGTGLIGVALAIANVLMPAVIKRDFPLRVPLMMGVYSALLGGAEPWHPVWRFRSQSSAEVTSGPDGGCLSFSPAEQCCLSR